MNHDVLASTLRSMYQSYGSGVTAGIAHVTPFLPTLQLFDFSEIIKFLIKHHTHQFVLDFILSSPSLWEKLDGSTWITILTSPNLRKDTLATNDQVAHFVDIEFLNRYVGVDALGFVIQSQDVSSIEKNQILSYFQKFSFALPSDRFDDEDLDGICFVSKQVLNDLHSRLVCDHNFAAFNVKEENIKKYLADITKNVP